MQLLDFLKAPNGNYNGVVIFYRYRLQQLENTFPLAEHFEFVS